MIIRQQTEEIERQTLHLNACPSFKSRGRLRPEEDDDIRTCFQKDRDRIIHSKAFRRLKHKTQVFLAPKGDHYRTRLTHVLEVSQIARTIARALRLNEDLVEAIAIGHDLGHTPFGHAGEAILREVSPGGFDHYKQSLRVVDFLEKDGQGLNLTYEVRDGILKHSKGKGAIVSNNADEMPITLEGLAVRISDIIAYINHDLDDAIRADVVSMADLPREVTVVVGDTHSKRIGTMVRDVIRESIATDLEDVRMSREISLIIYKIRDFLFERVYESREMTREFKKAKGVLKSLYEYYLEHIDEVSGDHSAEKEINRHRIVCDFIAGMTDSFALMTYKRLFLPQRWG
ncbi:MAG: deoxyguanosinetriphosphate triphosphohydrolase [Thermodesulfovibrionales bacterium]|nr:deoxyguanosinetriphosphate triphosphohydrolase [Thermodesulfovibrionales bacterium]